MKKNALKVTAVLAILVMMPITASAKKGGNRDGRRHGPPPEAIEACEGKEIGDSVEFTGRRGETLKATCKEIDDQIVAVPEGRPSGGHSE